MKLTVIVVMGFVHCLFSLIITEQGLKDRYLLSKRKRKKLIESFTKTEIKKNRPKRRKNKRKLFDVAGAAGGMGAEDDFPPLPPADQMPIIINSPPVNLPKFKSPYQMQSKLVFVPTIIYPKKKKRIVVHHNATMADYFRKSYFNPNPYYMQMAKNNPYYKKIWESQGVQNTLTKYPGITEDMNKIQGFVPPVPVNPWPDETENEGETENKEGESTGGAMGGAANLLG